MSSIALLRRSILIWLPTAAANAVVQTLLVAGDPIPTRTSVFILLALVSGVSVVAALAIVARGFAIAAGGGPVTWRGALTGGASWLWSGILVVTGAASAVVLPVLVVAVILVAAILLPVAAAGALNPWPAAGRGFIRQPLRRVFAAIGIIVLACLAAAGALLLGFFVTGPLAAAITWLSFGGIAVLVLAHGSVVMSRLTTRA